MGTFFNSKKVDKDVFREEKCVLGKEKCALECYNVKYFGAKFEFFKVNYFWDRGSIWV